MGERILAFDASSGACSACVAEDGRVLSSVLINQGLTHSQTLLPAVEKILRNGGQVSTPGMEMECRVYSESGEFLGLGSSGGARLRLIKSFFEV